MEGSEDSEDSLPILHHAVYSRSLNRVKWVLDTALFDANSVDSSNTTALHIAANEGYTAIARYLLERGADIDALDCLGYSPLHFGVRSGGVAMVRLLLEYGAKVNTMNIYRISPFQDAVINIAGYPKIVQMLKDASFAQGRPIDNKSIV